MHNHRISLLLSALIMGLSFTLSPANAQTSPSAATAEAKAERKAAQSADDAWQRTHRASKIVGTEVRNAKGQKIGTVKDLVLADPQSGRISQMVVAVGGVLGMGDKLFAVPFEQVQIAPDGKHVVLSGSNDLAQAFDEKHWPGMPNRTISSGTDNSPTAASMSPSTTSGETSSTSNAMTPAPSPSAGTSGTSASDASSSAAASSTPGSTQ